MVLEAAGFYSGRQDNLLPGNAWIHWGYLLVSGSKSQTMWGDNCLKPTQILPHTLPHRDHLPNGIFCFHLSPKLCPLTPEWRWIQEPDNKLTVLIILNNSPESEQGPQEPESQKYSHQSWIRRRIMCSYPAHNKAIPAQLVINDRAKHIAIVSIRMFPSSAK